VHATRPCRLAKWFRRPEPERQTARGCARVTCVWWYELLKYPPPQIHVSTPRRIQSIESIIVHDRRTIQRTWHKRLPVTTPAQAILDFAATGDTDLLRLVLANADYHDALDVRERQRITGHGIKRQRRTQTRPADQPARDTPTAVAADITRWL
jgi:hypothetical protein